jgi:hypothetical protein
MTLEQLGAAGTFFGCALGAAISVGVVPSTPVDGSRLFNEVICEVPNVVVHSPNRPDALVACEGARDATAFLASQGLDVRGKVSIDVVQVLPPEASPSAAGYYLHAQNRVVVLAYSAFRKFGTWFDVAIDPSLYRSLVAHEVAHAIAASNFGMLTPAIQAHEYIAYVTMFATMAPAQRERVLAQYPGDAFEDDTKMSATIYLFDPMRFGVRAYRHFLHRTDGREYLHAVLAGRALTE